MIFFYEKSRLVLTKKIMYYQNLGSEPNPHGALDFSPLYFFSKRKMAL